MAPKVLKRLKGRKSEDTSKQAFITASNGGRDELSIEGPPSANINNQPTTLDTASHAAAFNQRSKRKRIAAAANKVVNKTHLKAVARLFWHRNHHSEASTIIPSVPSLPSSNDDKSSYAELLPLSDSELGSSLSSSLSSTKTFDFINLNDVVPVQRTRITPVPLPHIYRPKTRRDDSRFFGGHDLDHEREVLRNTSAFTFATTQPSSETAKISVSTSSDHSADKSAGAQSISNVSTPDGPTSEGADQDLEASTLSFHEGDDTVIQTDQAVVLSDEEEEALFQEWIYEWPAPPTPPRNPRCLDAANQSPSSVASPSASTEDDTIVGTTEPQLEVSNEVASLSSVSRDGLGTATSADPEPVAATHDITLTTPSPKIQQTSEQATQDENEVTAQQASTSILSSRSNPELPVLGRRSQAAPLFDATTLYDHTAHRPTSHSSASQDDTLVQAPADYASSKTPRLEHSTPHLLSSESLVPRELTFDESTSETLPPNLPISVLAASNDTIRVNATDFKRSEEFCDATLARQLLGQFSDTASRVAANAKQATTAVPSKRSRFKSFFQKDYHGPSEIATQHDIFGTSAPQLAASATLQGPGRLSRTASILSQSKQEVRSKLSKAASFFQLPRDVLPLPSHDLKQLPPSEQFPVSLTAAPVTLHGSVIAPKHYIGSKRSSSASFLRNQEQQSQNITIKPEQEKKDMELNVTSGWYPSMFSKNGMLVDVPLQAVLDRLSTVQPPRQYKRKIPVGAQSDHDRARFTNATGIETADFVNPLDLSFESFLDTASKTQRGNGNLPPVDGMFSKSLIPEPLSPRAFQDDGVLTPGKPHDLAKKPDYAHPIGMRNHHVRPSHDDTAVVNRRPGTPFTHGAEKKLLHPARPAAFDPDESMLVNASSSPQLPDLPHDSLPAHMLNIPARIATVDDALVGARGTERHASEQYANDDRALKRYPTYVGKGKTPMSPLAMRRDTSGLYGYRGGPVQPSVDSPDRALRAVVDSGDVYTYSSDNSFEDSSDVHFPSESAEHVPTNAYTHFPMINERGQTVRHYYGTCPKVIAPDGRFLQVEYTPPSTPKEQIIIPAHLWAYTEAGLLIHPAVRPAEESWETAEESDAPAIDWTIAPRLKFDVNKPTPSNTPTRSRDVDGASSAARSSLDNSPSALAQQRLDRIALQERASEREDRLGFLFLHRKTYAQRCRALWPDQPTKQVAIDADNMSSNDNHAQAREDALAEANEDLYKRFHRTLVLANLEGDFAIFDHSPEVTAEFLEKYRLIPAPEIEDFLAGNMEQHQPVDFLAEQHVQDTMVLWKAGRTPKYFELHRLGIPFANIFVSRRGSAYGLQQLTIPRRIWGKEDPEIDELEARGVQIETIPEHELLRWDELRAQMLAVQDTWNRNNPMPVHGLQDEDLSASAAREDHSAMQHEVQSEANLTNRGQAVSEIEQTPFTGIDLTTDSSGHAGEPTDDSMTESSTAEPSSETDIALGQAQNPIVIDETLIEGPSTMQDDSPIGREDTATQAGFYISDQPSAEEQTDFLKLYKATKRPDLAVVAAISLAAAAVPLSAVPAWVRQPLRRPTPSVLPQDHPTRLAVQERLEAWRAGRRAEVTGKKASSTAANEKTPDVE